MIAWNEIDSRLAALGKDRQWLASVTPYSPDTIRTALAPKSTKRSERMLQVLAKAIEDEEAKVEAPNTVTPDLPGVLSIFRTEEEFDLADRASRLVGAPSLSDYCHDVIMAESERILEAERVTEGKSLPSHRGIPPSDMTPNGGSAATA